MTEILEHLAGRTVIVGSGLAGLMTALTLAPEPSVIVTRAALGAETSSAWAQGGIAASVGADDSAALHLADTLAVRRRALRSGHCRRHHRRGTGSDRRAGASWRAVRPECRRRPLARAGGGP